MLNANSLTPIYVQIATWLEDRILAGDLAEDERIYSQYQLAELFNINPATAAKGLNILADNGLVYKKRGLGMFVAPNAQKQVEKNRRSGTLHHMIANLVLEAQHLAIGDDELLTLIQTALKER